MMNRPERRAFVTATRSWPLQSPNSLGTTVQMASGKAEVVAGLQEVLGWLNDLDRGLVFSQHSVLVHAC